MSSTLTQTITAEDLHEKLKHVKMGGTACHYSLKKCQEFVPLINEINHLKKKQNAVVLVHSYVSPEIIYGVADFVGDSYGLSRNAMDTDAKTIIFVAVRFMGETAKILNPHKEVLIPSELNGCTLADAISAAQVRELRKQYPEHTFVCYINTTAEVKAECDVCVTSANANKIIAALPTDKVYFLPDKLMGENIKNELKKRGVSKDIQYYPGTCYVHEEFDPEMIRRVRLEYPGVKVVSHPECTPEVIRESDFVGSTSQMLKFMETTSDKTFLMLTECGLGARLQVEFPDKRLVATCAQCKYMKSNTLEDVRRVLKGPSEEDRIEVPEAIRARALGCIEKMFLYA